MAKREFVIYAERNRLPGREYTHPKRVPFPTDRKHDQLTFALEDARRLFDSDEFEYVVVKDWFNNVIADWHK